MKQIVLMLTALAMLTFPVIASAATWTLDPEHSYIGFKIRHLMVSNVKGDFKKYTGTIEIDDKDLAKSKVNVAIETASIDTGIAKRDDHLRSADFFDVAKYPIMSYVSRKVVSAGEGKLKVYGDLTLHGVTREVVLDVDGPTAAIKDPWGNTKRGASAAAKINRKDFGLTWNKAVETGGVVVGDEVTILIEVELLKK
ncbi:MAG: polyisoprenoid-binding protein [Desulfuromonadales bacterium]|nr:MAG: polyisoprenoid-binding protein [Desulfuromonadales bacterium]